MSLKVLIPKGFEYFKKGFEHLNTGGVFDSILDYYLRPEKL